MPEDYVGVDSLHKLARGLAEGVLTRRQTLKLFGASILALLLPTSFADARQRKSDPPTLDEFLEAAALTLSGVSPTAFNSIHAQLKFNLKGARFSQVRKADTVLTVNDQIVPVDEFKIASDSITAADVLTDGKNVVHLESVDTVGRPLYFERMIWAGANTLRVNLVGENGKRFRKKATVTVRLADDQAVHGRRIRTDTGVCQFSKLPDSTLLIRATASGNRFGEIGVTGDAGIATVTMRGFEAPSPVDNNDFSQGTDGWNVGSAPVQIVPHQEAVGPT